MIKLIRIVLVLAMIFGGSGISAQVSEYSFSSTQGTWSPIVDGTPMGYQLIDDEVFVSSNDNLGSLYTTTGPGWPIGFTFHFNGIPFDRVGISTEGWLSLGQSSRGQHAVYLPISGNAAYSPISTATDPLVDPILRHRIVPFATDLRAQAGWPILIKSIGTAPNRTFIIQWNNLRPSQGSAAFSLSFQVRLNEGGANPADQVVQVVYGPMTVGATISGEVGLGGATNADHNSRSITGPPYDWTASTSSPTNEGTTIISSSNTVLPLGLTYTWTPPACSVAGLQASDLTVVDGALSVSLDWSATQIATSYNILVTSGSPTDQSFANESVTGTSIQLSGLPANMPLFVYVRPNCEPAAPGWGMPLVITGENHIDVVCGEPPVQRSYCYENYDQQSWTFTSSDGSPLRAQFSQGVLSNGDRLRIFDGDDNGDPVLLSLEWNSIATGQMVTSTGAQLYFELEADGSGSCGANTWVEPLEWEVGCMDCEPVLANYKVQTVCEEQHYFVEVFLASMGSATEVTITNTAGIPASSASQVGSYQIGPFELDSLVSITVENPDNPYCNSFSGDLVNGPCAVIGCGPDQYSHCYSDNEQGQWLYRSANNERIGIRFFEGTLPAGDAILIFDGEDPFMSGLLFQGNNGGDLTGLIRITPTTSNTLLLELNADASVSCTSGLAEEWDYTISCFNGCVAPTAAFTVVDDCDNGQFSVQVEIEDVGSNGVLSIQNDGGADEVPITGVGIYSAGPFEISAQVRISIEGDHVLCPAISSPMVSGCMVGMEDPTRSPITIYPNPSPGFLHVVMGEGTLHGMTAAVYDPMGRKVHEEVFSGRSHKERQIDLGHLPNGWYVLVLRSDDSYLRHRIEMMR